MHPVRILCAADLHLGKRITRLPEELEDLVQAPKMAWENFVAFATESSQHIHAVVLAGDIFDNEQNLYEAAGIFERGVRRILACNIPVIAVAGNHDGNVLAKLFMRLNAPNFYFLGKEGSWETITLQLQGRLIRFIGWSFTSSKYNGDPLDTFPKEEEALFSIGVLHCDVDAGKSSPYAPVELRRFKELSPRAWVLGHVHIPSVLLEDPLVCYCGSLQGLDISESGERGAALLEILSSQKVVSTHIPLAPLHFHSQAVELSNATALSLDGDLCALLKDNLGELKDRVKAILCRFVFQGRTQFYKEWRSFADKIEGKEFTQVGKFFVPCFIESIIIRCTPLVDIKNLAKGSGFAAVIAHLIQEIKDGRILKDAAAFLQSKIEKNGQLEISVDLKELEQSLVLAGYEVLDHVFSEGGE